MTTMFKMTAAAMTLVAAGMASAPAQAGILINADGIFLTDPDPSLATGIVGTPYWGGPGTGFRRFGRDGFFALPRDTGLPFHGRTAYGAASRKLDDRIRAEQKAAGNRSSIFDYIFN
ncbi:MAG: hypothetical protein AAFV19_11085 [Pseudomonadota bacterium]